MKSSLRRGGLPVSEPRGFKIIQHTGKLVNELIPEVAMHLKQSLTWYAFFLAFNFPQRFPKTALC